MDLLRCVLALVAACSACSVVANPDYEEAPPIDDAGVASTSGSFGEQDATSALAPGSSGDSFDPEGLTTTGEDGSSGGGDHPACTENADPIQGPCPAECDGCELGICRIACDGEQACKEAELACPAGRPCLVHCTGKQACEKASLQCSAAHACEIACSGEQSCIGLRLTCGGGTCDLSCGTGKDACKDVHARCGPQHARVSCTSPAPDLEVEPLPGSACACEIDDACLDSDD